jgi:hypothetical protein
VVVQAGVVGNDELAMLNAETAERISSVCDKRPGCSFTCRSIDNS